MQDKGYIGIDPGKSGGLALIVGDSVDYAEMPSSDMDLLDILHQFDQEAVGCHCFLERVRTMPGEGSKGAFTFGEGFGKIQMALTARQIPYELVQPRSWQKSLNIPPKKIKIESKPQFKDRLRQKAQELFPTIGLWNSSLTRQRAICDALLIAESCRRTREYSNATV